MYPLWNSIGKPKIAELRKALEDKMNSDIFEALGYKKIEDTVVSMNDHASVQLEKKNNVIYMMLFDASVSSFESYTVYNSYWEHPEYEDTDVLFLVRFICRTSPHSISYLMTDIQEEGKQWPSLKFVLTATMNGALHTKIVVASSADVLTPIEQILAWYGSL